MGDPAVLSERKTVTPRELAAIVGDAIAAVGDTLNDPAVKEQSTEITEALERALNETVHALPATGRHAGGREPYIGDVEEAAQKDDEGHRVLFSGEYGQLAVITLVPGQVLGEENRPGDQIFLLIKGQGECETDGTARPFTGHTALCVPAGNRHRIRNTSKRMMRIATVYAPSLDDAGIAGTKAEGAKPDATSPA
jgi:quercetin dioxygenase-like cupin family protein